MTRKLQRGAVEHAHPIWMRVLACVCLVVLAMAGSAQAVHVHGQFLPVQAAQAGAPTAATQVPGGEASCPLCVAMHAALPVSVQADLVYVLLTPGRVVLAEDRVRGDEWHFAMFSRPPPAVGSF